MPKIEGRRFQDQELTNRDVRGSEFVRCQFSRVLFLDEVYTDEVFEHCKFLNCDLFDPAPEQLLPQL